MTRMAAGLVLVTLLCGCLGGNEDDGALDPAVLHQARDHATFQVRVPALGEKYRLLSVSPLTGPNGIYGLSFDVIAGEGPILSVAEGEGARVGVIKTYTRGASRLAREWLGGGVWNVYSQPSVGGFVYARRYEGGVEAAVFGEDRAAVRMLAGSLGVRI